MLFVFRFGQPIKVNWAYASGQREDTSSAFSSCFSIMQFVTSLLVHYVALECVNLCTNFFLVGHFNVFVGDLSPEVTDAMLFACFSVYPSCS